jgi:hypothetical protein
MTNPNRELHDAITDRFCRHIVSLAWIDVPRRVDLEQARLGLEQCITTGFVVSVRNVWFLVTAGHILIDREKRLAELRRPIRTHLIDGLASKTNTTPIPFDLASAQKWVFDDAGLDFAVILLSPLYVAQLFAGGVIPISEDGWRHTPETPAHRYVVGFPTILKRTQKHLGLHETGVESITNLISLPLYHVSEIPEQLVQNSSNRIYGHIPCGVVKQLDGSETVVDDIDGLSGGPIVDLYRAPDNKMVYSVVGIQNSWLGPKRVVAGTRLRPILEAIDTLVERALQT